MKFATRRACTVANAIKHASFGLTASTYHLWRLSATRATRTSLGGSAAQGLAKCLQRLRKGNILSYSARDLQSLWLHSWRQS
eukprot:11032671-Karenia_brevis.AAC.1